MPVAAHAITADRVASITHASPVNVAGGGGFPNALLQTYAGSWQEFGHARSSSCSLSGSCSLFRRRQTRHDHIHQSRQQGEHPSDMSPVVDRREFVRHRHFTAIVLERFSSGMLESRLRRDAVLDWAVTMCS